MSGKAMEKSREAVEYGEELLRMVEEFRQKIIAGTSSAEKFMSITEIERLWASLRGETNILYSEMLSGLLSEVDEGELIRKKNGIQELRLCFAG